MTVAAAAILCIVFPAIAQEESNDEPLNVEELFLSSYVSVESIAGQIEFGGPEVQELALNSIEAGIASGQLDPTDEGLFEAIEPLVDRGVIEIRSNPNRTYEAYDPFLRRHATEVMGLLGTLRAQTKLVSLALDDPEPAVQVAALYGIASIAIDTDGEVTRSIARVLFEERAQEPNQETSFAAALAVSAIADDPSNVIHPSVREELVYVASDFRYFQRVRNAALIALSKL